MPTTYPLYLFTAAYYYFAIFVYTMCAPIHISCACCTAIAAYAD